MSTGQVTVVEYLEPVLEAEALPEEFSPSSLRRSLLIVGAIVLGVVALIVLVPGLSSLRERFMGAQPDGSRSPRCSSWAPARATSSSSAASSAGG